MITSPWHETTLHAWSWQPGRKARDAAHALSMVQRVAAVGGNPEAAMPRNAAAAAVGRACQDEAGEKRVPCDGVPRGHFVEQAGRSAWESRVRVGGEEGSGRDRDGTREGGGLEQDGVNSGGERGVGGEEPEQGGHRRRPRSTRHFVERTSPLACRTNRAAEGANGMHRVYD